MRWFLFIVGLVACLLFSQPSFAAGQAAGGGKIQVAFIREGNLWVKMNGMEKQLTRDRTVSSPKWSSDGDWIAYCAAKDPAFHNQRTLRVKNIQTDQDTTVAVLRHQPCDIAWSPNKDILAFLNDSILNDIDMSHLREQGFRNVSLGVAQFSWLPDGTGFLVSASARALPDGWTHARLFTIPRVKGTSLLNTAVPYCVLPKEVGVSGANVRVIGTSKFKWSHDGKWLAFIVHPWASQSMDSNILCVLSIPHNRLIPVAEMLDRSDWFEWAPKSSEVAFIEGGGRFVTAKKRLAVAAAPQFRAVAAFTPSGFVDNAFTWNDDMSLTVSRAREGEYQGKFPQQQRPALHRVGVSGKTVRKMTRPPVGSGDYQPKTLRGTPHLLWVRATDNAASLWIADKDGANQVPWITNMSREQWTPYRSMWHDLVDIRRILNLPLIEVSLKRSQSSVSS